EARASGAWVGGDLLVGGADRLPCEGGPRSFGRLLPDVERARRADRVLHDPILQGMIGDHAETALRPRAPRGRGEERFELLHLVVHGDAERLERLGQAAGTLGTGIDGLERVAQGPRREGLYGALGTADRAHGGPCARQLAIGSEDPLERSIVDASN